MSRSSEFPTRRRSSGTGSRASGHPQEMMDDEFDDVAVDDSVDYGEDEERDWERVGAFAAGLGIGAALGAGLALLFAPQSGEDTRGMLGLQARHLGDRAADGWDDLRDEFRWLARRGRKSIRRGMTRSRWAAQDVVERGRRKVR
ncbi:MAG TPA: YtxH domain-containing protein [Gemmatimonadaceae bacterium]|nr:YtxH domain-containing protein [Gemmatimonadaceae bacterium]